MCIRDRVCRSAGYEPDARYISSDLQSHVGLVASGNAVALLPGLMLVDTPPAVRRIRLAGDPVRTVFTSIRSSSAQSPAITAVRGILEEAAAGIHPAHP